jgi:hypothetical protein
VAHSTLEHSQVDSDATVRRMELMHSSTPTRSQA